jgi:isocitrate lyase
VDCVADANVAGEMYPDQLYGPVRLVVKRINKRMLRADQNGWLLTGEKHTKDYLVPNRS